MHSVSKHVNHMCCYLFFSFTFSLLSVFSRQMTAGAITALTFRKLKEITIKELLGVGKTCCTARFPCDSTAFLIYFVAVYVPVSVYTL